MLYHKSRPTLNHNAARGKRGYCIIKADLCQINNNAATGKGDNTTLDLSKMNNDAVRGDQGVP